MVALPRRSAAAAGSAALGTCGAERANTAASPDPNDSDSSLSSVEDDPPPPKRARRAAAAPAAQEPAANELYAAVLDDTTDEASENWVVAFQGEPGDALAELVTFLFRVRLRAASV